MIDELLRWWARQMLDLVPAGLRRMTGAGGEALAVACDAPSADPPTVALTQRKRAPTAGETSFRLDAPGIQALRQAVRAGTRRNPVVLRLPAAELLERSVVLPLAAEREPAQVMRYEIDRITPFRADEIFWTFAIEQRDRANAKLHVRLFLIPIVPLRPVLRALADAGLSVAVIEAARRGQPPCRIPLDRTVTGRERWARRSLTVGWALCGALAVAAIVLPFVMQSVTAAATEDRIAALRPGFSEAEALRRRIASGASGIDVMTAERTRVGDALAVLAAVTDALPDDTFLNELTLRQGHLTMNGQSTGAARLIGALSAEPIIRNPSFDAPVTHVDQAKADLFSIRAEAGVGK